MVSRALLWTALANAGCRVAYVGKTRDHARELCWSKLKRLCADVGVQYVPNETRLDMVLPNGSIIMLAGAKDESECDKLRGLAYHLIVLDEAGSFSDAAMKYLLREVLPAGLSDYRGTLMVCGTPDPTCEGYFHDVATDPRRGATVWHWTVADNPRFPRWAARWEQMTPAERQAEVEAYFAEECATWAIDRQSPEFQREYLGLWSRDATEFCYHLGQLHPWEEPPEDLRCVLGMDFGWIDMVAFVVVGYSQELHKVWELETWAAPSLTFDDIKVQFDRLVSKWHPEYCVADPAGEGKIIRESLTAEMWRRFGIAVNAAEKQEKGAFMRLADSAIRTGHALLRPEGDLFHQLSPLQWDKHRVREKEGQPCDLHDAWLYAFRHCYHWLEADAPAKPLTREEQLEAEYWKARNARGENLS